jgi:hypothetical protein
MASIEMFWRVLMAIESAMFFRRLARTGLSVLVATLSVSGFAMAQTPVTTGSPVATTHPLWGQVTKVQVAKNGSTVFLDWSTSGLYQLRPGATTFTTIASGAPLEAAGTFWNSGMVMDAKDTSSAFHTILSTEPGISLQPIRGEPQSETAAYL